MNAYQLVAAGYFAARALEWAEHGKVWWALGYALAAFVLFHLGRRRTEAT